MGRPDADTLRQLYVNEKLTLSECADRLEVSTSAVHTWLVAAQIPRRPSVVGRRADVDDDDIRRLYTEAGLTAAEIAARLGCSNSLVYFRLDHLGIPRRPAIPRDTARPDDKELLQGYVEEGLSLRQLADRYEVTATAVRRWLINAGIPRRPNKTPGPDVKPDKVVELYEAGWSGPQIADEYGCSTAFVYRHLETAGVPRRKATKLARDQLVAALDRGLSAPQIADQHDVTVACVCRALAREDLQTASQARRRQRPKRMAHFHAMALDHDASPDVAR